MEKVKLLIADNVKENRAVLRSIAEGMGCFIVYETDDGIDALELVAMYRPNIIIVDVPLPRLDGFHTAKLIKLHYPESIVMALACVSDPNMEKNMAAIGVAAYIHKPIDKELIRFKLQSFEALLRSRKKEYMPVSVEESSNPFSRDIRHFKTLFTIINSEAMMDFGLWILTRCENGTTVTCPKIDTAVELLYELMRQKIRTQESLNIIVEESFNEVFITMQFATEAVLHAKAEALHRELGEQSLIQGNITCIRLRFHENESLSAIEEQSTASEQTDIKSEEQNLLQEGLISSAVLQQENTQKETKVLQTKEKEFLRQSFVTKTSAQDYIEEIGGDVLDEIRDLESLDEEWTQKLHMLHREASAKNLCDFVDNVLGVYVKAINGLFEFTALAYALLSLGSFLKENAEMIVFEPAKLRTLLMLLEHLGADLTSWREHIFMLQDTADIHYLDSSFFSSCMQIEGIIANKEVAADDDDDGMEFF
jgi:CheY-like chemotaxis protein